MLLKDFKIDLEQETIYACKHVLIHEYLSYFNYRTNLEIVDLFNLDVVPAIQFENKKMKMLYLSTRCTNKEDYYDFYGIDLSVVQHNSFDLGWKYIVDNLKNGKPTIVSGTQYYLKYSKTYLSDRYFDDYGKGIYGICNHWIMVLGCFNEEVYVRDPSYQYLGTISLADFKKFWEGDSQFEKRIPMVDRLYRFGCIDIKVNEDINASVPQNICAMSIRKYLKVFMMGKVQDVGEIYLGVYAYTRLIELLNEEEWNNNLLDIYNFLHLQKFNMKIVNNALKSVCTDNKEMLTILSELDNCSHLMEEMCMKLYMCILRKRFDKNSRESIIIYLKKILNILTNDYSLLLKKGEFS